MESKYRIASALALFTAVCLGGAAGAWAAGYVGSKACSECHDEQCLNFTRNSKKVNSWHSIEMMSSDLTEKEQRGCYECHTTGYGKGGFRSIESTPELAHVGCETCHGPGVDHAGSGDPEEIQRTPTIEECETCHNADRVENFNFKPLLHSGAH